MSKSRLYATLAAGNIVYLLSLLLVYKGASEFGILGGFIPIVLGIMIAEAVMLLVVREHFERDWTMEIGWAIIAAYVAVNSFFWVPYVQWVASYYVVFLVAGVLLTLFGMHDYYEDAVDQIVDNLD